MRLAIDHMCKEKQWFASLSCAVGCSHSGTPAVDAVLLDIGILLTQVLHL
jgi:hypothetical protein